MRSDRLDTLEKYILENRNVSIDTLCETFNVSRNTIRRDLSELEKRGYVTKVYGGVAAVHPEEFVPVPVRSTHNKEAKELIGKLAAQLVNDGDTIFVDSGTTAINIIPHLLDKRNVTVVTHAMTVLSLVTKYPEFNVMAVGGQYNPDTNAFFGPETIEGLEGLHIGKAFLGCSGLTAESGISNMTYYEPILKNKVIERSQKVILMTDTSKMGHNATRCVCPLSKVQVLVSEARPPEDIIAYCRRYNIEIVCNN